jgi:hypothetical protein
MYRQPFFSRTARTSAPKKSRVRLEAVNPAMMTSWRFEVLIFSQSAAASGHVPAVRALCHDAFKALASGLFEESGAERLAVSAEGDQVITRQNGSKPLFALEPLRL